VVVQHTALAGSLIALCHTQAPRARFGAQQRCRAFEYGTVYQNSLGSWSKPRQSFAITFESPARGLDTAVFLLDELPSASCSVWCGCGLTCSLAVCARCRPTELPRNVSPSGLKNSSKLIRLKINGKQSQAVSSQQHADPASSLGTAVGSSSSSSSSSQQPSSLLYSAQVGTNGWAW
jgi:hypothetical protein